MYIAGRFRTASRPSRTLILSAPYSSPGRTALGFCPVWPVFESVFDIRWFGLSTPSDPHRHDHVGVVVAFRADRLDDRLAHLILELEPYVFGFHHSQEVVDVI